MPTIVRIFVLVIFSWVSPLYAQTEASSVTEIDPITQAGRIPVKNAGAWRKQVQLVWSPVARKLERRSYEIFDPFAHQGYDLFWQPRNPDLDRGGRLSGEGVLTWRRKGTSRSSADGIEAQFIGTLRDGAAHGYGRFNDVSGLNYLGDWIGGVMSGSGHLISPQGDAYTGAFLDGKPHGLGLFIDATGLVHEGQFAQGKPHGRGFRATPDGQTISSVWKVGIESKSTRAKPPVHWSEKYRYNIQSAETQGLDISLSVGDVNQFCCTDNPALGYAAISGPSKLAIFPDDPVLIDQWRGRSNIAIEDPLSFDWTRALSLTYSFLNYDETVPEQLPLRFGLRNSTNEAVEIAASYLEIDRSRIDTQPMIQSLILKPMSPQNLEFSIENFGWAIAENMELIARFVSPNGATERFKIDIGDVADISQFSFAPALARFGVSIADLPSIATTCAGIFGQDQNPEGCTERLVQSGMFAGLSSHMITDTSNGTFGVRAVGEVRYEWRDGNGATQTTVAPFDGHVPLAALRSRAECEGGDFELLNDGKPFLLRERGDNYEIGLPIFSSVQAGEERRWEVALTTTKSSNHDMRVVFELADGRIVRSRDVSALMFQPRQYPSSIRPFEPRC
ncbi:MAG: hypothetical protein AAGD04_04420 [Pseudomonadota bacterium]